MHHKCQCSALHDVIMRNIGSAKRLAVEQHFLYKILIGRIAFCHNLAGGAPIMSVKIDSQDKRFDLNLPKGIYIIKVGKIARKIVIK